MVAVVELELPARPDYLALARLIVVAAATSDPTFANDRIDDLRLAVSEACTNAVEAQRRAIAAGGGEAPIRIRCRLDGDRMEVEVEDHGAGFDPGGLVPHPPVHDPARLDHERGLGIPLIRMLTDEVDFEPTADGTRVRMVLYGEGTAGNGSELASEPAPTGREGVDLRQGS